MKKLKGLKLRDFEKGYFNGKVYGYRFNTNYFKIEIKKNYANRFMWYVFEKSSQKHIMVSNDEYKIPSRALKNLKKQLLKLKELL